MTFSEFSALVQNNNHAVVLIEGKRDIPPDEYEKAFQLAKFLATKFSQLRFRSGNADGSDEAFSKGVKDIDPMRLEVFSPYRGHKTKNMIQVNSFAYPENLTAEQEQSMIDLTLTASPKYKSLMKSKNASQANQARARYIIRDTMKVGYTNEIFHKPVAALFYVNFDDIDSGGTGHTIRVCKTMRVPVILQDQWHSWLT